MASTSHTGENRGVRGIPTLCAMEEYRTPKKSLWGLGGFDLETLKGIPFYHDYAVGAWQRHSARILLWYGANPCASGGDPQETWGVTVQGKAAWGSVSPEAT